MLSSLDSNSLPPLELFNLLIQPIWIFDFIEERNRWANTAGLKLWSSPDVNEFCSRDRTQRSESTLQKLRQVQAKIEQGGSVSVHWTLYPKGQATTVHITVTGIQLGGHYCMLFHGVPEDTEKLETKSLRGVEMLRHLPMAVCQFDMSGKIMFQNQWAQLPDLTTSSVNVSSHPVDASDKDSDGANSKAEEQSSPSKGESNVAKPSPSHDSCVTHATSTLQLTSANNNDDTSDFTRRFVNKNVAREALETIKATTKQVIQLEAELYSTVHAGNREWSEVSLRKTTDPITGKVVILYSAQDKSDAKNAQREREASILKSEFLAIMAHEIRTPLHQVIGFIDLLDQTQPLHKEQKGYIKLLQASAEGLLTVISDVLDYSKLEAGEMKMESIPYEPRSVLEGSLAAVRAKCVEKGLALTLVWCKDIPFRILGDPNRVRQVMLNLLSNAIKFTKQGAVRVDVCIMNSGHPFLQQSESCHNSSSKRGKVCSERYVRVVVSDTGQGISEESQQTIFQKYQQGNLSVARTHGGTGLGLSICQQLVHSMGGAIGVNSQLGQGSKFWFFLPVWVPQSQSVIAEIEPPFELHDQITEGFNVLVVEDNRVNQKLIANMLKRLGHQSTIAANGQIAIDLIKDNSVSFFDLVLMDIMMPVMDGVEATKRLRTMGYTELPILALTANVKQNDYRELGFDDWLPKPIPLKDLKERILRAKQGDSKLKNVTSTQ